MSSQNLKSKAKKKKRGIAFKFMVVLVSMVGVFSVLATAAVLGYNYITGSQDTVETDSVVKAIQKELTPSLVTEGGSVFDLFTAIPERTVFALFGLDKAGGARHTDIIIVGCYNSKEQTLDLISVPRDTYAIMPSERYQILVDNKLPRPSSSRIMKINAPYNYGGNKFGKEFAIAQVNELLNISIEYYAIVDIEAFRYVVDLIDGVEFNVPQRMYYNDPYQDLTIDLYPGLQILYGKDAEGLVRYRQADETNKISKGYPMGDLDRIKVTQSFLTAMITQVLSKDSLLNNAFGLLEAITKYVETNMPITDALKYLSFIKDLKAENIRAYTIPGEPETSGTSYFMPDNAKIHDLVQEIFYKNSDE